MLILAPAGGHHVHRSELCHRGGVHACRDALLLPSLPELLPVQAEGTSRRKPTSTRKRGLDTTVRHKALWQVTLLHCSPSQVYWAVYARTHPMRDVGEARRLPNLPAGKESAGALAPPALSGSAAQRCRCRATAPNGLDVRHVMCPTCHKRDSGLPCQGRGGSGAAQAQAAESVSACAARRSPRPSLILVVPEPCLQRAL